MVVSVGSDLAKGRSIEAHNAWVRLLYHPAQEHMYVQRLASEEGSGEVRRFSLQDLERGKGTRALKKLLLGRG